ncbi:MAG: stage III sporulation protein AE [Christensenellaceae bacterium]|nr:stage III sporulation protein AE [Christensenellaceae bacterium]
MRKILIILIVTLLLVIASPLKREIFNASATSEEDELMDEISRELDQLFIKGELEKFFQQLENENKYDFGIGFRDAVEKILRGEYKSVNDFYNLIFKAITTSVSKILFSSTIIIVLSLLYSLSKNLTSGFLRNETNNVIYYVIYSSVLLVLCTITTNSIILVKSVLTQISNLSEIAMPILITLVTAVGGVGSASSYSTITIIFSEVVIKIADKVIMPMYIACIVFSFISGFSKNIKLDRLISAIQTIAKWIMGTMFGVIIATTATHGIVGAAVDGISIRSAKFALSSYVPILGGYLSQGFDVITASAVLLKNSIGICSIILLFLVVVKPIVEIVITSLAFKILAGITQIIQVDGISDLLNESAKNLGILVALLLGCVFLVCLIIIGMISAFNGIV